MGGIGTCKSDELVFYMLPSPQLVEQLVEKSVQSTMKDVIFNRIAARRSYIAVYQAGGIEKIRKIDALLMYFWIGF